MEQRSYSFLSKPSGTGNSSHQQHQEIMSTLSRILQAQESIAQKIDTVLQRQAQVVPQDNTLDKAPFTYEMFETYMSTRLFPQLEERARIEAPCLLDIRYLVLEAVHLYNFIKKLNDLGSCVGWPREATVDWISSTLASSI
jgi:hypothetical protein